MYNEKDKSTQVDMPLKINQSIFLNKQEIEYTHENQFLAENFYTHQTDQYKIPELTKFPQV